MITSQSLLLIMFVFVSFMFKMVLNMKSAFEIMTNSVVSVDRSFHFYIQHRFHLNEFSLGNSIGNFLESYTCSLQAQLGEGYLICITIQNKWLILHVRSLPIYPKILFVNIDLCAKMQISDPQFLSLFWTLQHLVWISWRMHFQLMLLRRV